jgi:hypothetical protein
MNDVKIELTPEEASALAKVKEDYLLNHKSLAYYYMWVGILALRGCKKLPMFSFQLPKYIDDNIYLIRHY